MKRGNCLLESHRTKIQTQVHNSKVCAPSFYGFPCCLQQDVPSFGASQVVLVVKNLPANAGRHKRCGFDPQVRKIPWKRTWQPTPVFLPGLSLGQRSLAGYSPWGCKELDMTEQLSLHAPTGQGADTSLEQEQSEFLPKEIGFSWHLDA